MRAEHSKLQKRASFESGVMVECGMDGNTLRHQFTGEVGVRDIIAAQQYAAARLKSTHSVLWDFRKAILSKTDEVYRIFAGATVDSKTATPQVKRAFLACSEGHKSRIEETLSSAAPVWPWCVFLDEAVAQDWLTRDE
ncbi:MAG: hypothetical protein RIC89_22195 [Pseudomonadales bacterium]